MSILCLTKKTAAISSAVKGFYNNNIELLRRIREKLLAFRFFWNSNKESCMFGNNKIMATIKFILKISVQRNYDNFMLICVNKKMLIKYFMKFYCPSGNYYSTGNLHPEFQWD